MNKREYCYICGCGLIEGHEFDICNRCALDEKNNGETKQHVNATKMKKRRKPTDE